MTPRSEGPIDRVYPTRRPTVRIVQRRKLPRVAGLSLMMAIAAGAVAFAAWRWWRPVSSVPDVPQTVSRVNLTWKCEGNHTFTAQGQVEERLCAMCDKPAYAVTVYECKQHGGYDVAVRFEPTSGGGSRVSQIRRKGGEWTPAEAGLTCPKCDTPLVRRPTDPAEAALRGKKKSGG